MFHSGSRPGAVQRRVIVALQEFLESTDWDRIQAGHLGTDTPRSRCGRRAQFALAAQCAIRHQNASHLA